MLNKTIAESPTEVPSLPMVPPMFMYLGLLFAILIASK